MKLNILNIIKTCKLLNCGMFGCIFKFKYENKDYCIKFNFRKEPINYDKIYNFNLKDITTISKKYFYYGYDAEVKIQKMINKINGEDINGNKFPFTIKIYEDGKITNKNTIDEFKKIIYKKYIKKKTNNFWINEFQHNINICNEINYYIMDYMPNIQLSTFIYGPNIYNEYNIILKDLKQLHTYIFYVIYYLYLINEKYDFRHDDLHDNNIILVNDEEYEKGKKKYRIIKMNNNYYKLLIYPFRPYIIDFGFASIFSENIINQKIEYYDNKNDFINCKVINNQIQFDKNYNLINNLKILLKNILCDIKNNQIDYFINYLHNNNLNILELLFDYTKKDINKVNIILKKLKENKIDRECNDGFYKFIFNKLSNKNVYDFIKPFQIKQIK